MKNAVIVPVGAKGGFVVRRPEAGNDEVVACYKTFISGLLDVTDNLVDGKTVPPPDVVRHDGDDSYLVVAADKGTAKFSDIANEVATSYGFWLGDAFASGGSMGYDHKAMGITARGAWESVKRHFRELGVDTQAEEFTVVGVGDMSGDVSATGCCSPRTSGWSRRSTTATCSSTPSRTPRAASRSDSGCSRCRAPRGTTTTATRSARAAACGPARRSRCPSGRRCGRRWGSTTVSTGR